MMIKSNALLSATEVETIVKEHLNAKGLSVDFMRAKKKNNSEFDGYDITFKSKSIDLAIKNKEEKVMI